MAPRGRPCKKSARSEVAIEHMVKMGFEYEFVERTLRKLLKEYGEEGWWFIETDSYKELIEALLKPQETNPSLENGNGNAYLLEAAPVDDNIVDVPMAADAGKSDPFLLTSSFSAMDAIASPISAVEDMQVPLSSPSPPVNKDPVPMKTARRLEDMQGPLSPPSPPVDKDPVPMKTARRPEDMQVPLSPPSLPVNKDLVPVKSARRLVEDSQVPLSPPSPPVNKDPVPIKTARRRRPCYGWICDDDDGGEIIELPAAGPWKWK